MHHSHDCALLATGSQAFPKQHTPVWQPMYGAHSWLDACMLYACTCITSGDLHLRLPHCVMNNLSQFWQGLSPD